MYNMAKGAGLLFTAAFTLFLAACPDPDNTDVTRYTITIAASVNGSVSAGRETARAGESIILSIRPGVGYEPDSIRVRGVAASNAGDIPLEGSGSVRTFTMPAEDVAVYASFKRTIVEEPAVLYGISIMETGNGCIECRASAAAGTEVTLTLLPDEHYRCRAGSLIIMPELELVAIDEAVWTFTMPDEPVSITAEFEEIPAYTVSVRCENGAFDIDHEGEVREGTVVTVTASPDPGYKLAGGEPSVIPAGAVSFTQIEGQPAWTFTMADTDLEIGIAFAELGLLEIYKGGARRGITVGGLTDDNKFFRDCIDMESGGSGRGGSRQAIKITTALNANGNAAQQSFGLFSDTEIDLENAVAISFWAKANKSLNIRYVGFGDDDPNKRVVYIGENYNHAISVTAEWKHYIVPVPAAGSGIKTTRAFLFNANIAKDNYVCIDDIEFIESGVRVSGITIPGINEARYYGATAAAKMLKGADIAVSYTCDDGTVATLQCRRVTGTLKYDLAGWLTPFIGIDGDVTFADGVVYPKANSSTLTLSVNMGGVASNPMAVTVIDGLLLDDFENMESDANVSIPANPGSDKGYIWHSGAGGYVLIRDYVNTANSEIYSGLGSGNWRPNATTANPRGGRNFEAKDASGYTTLQFRIRVTAGTAASENFHVGTVFTFELKNGGELTGKTDGDFFTRQFTYETGGWQEVTMPLSDFADAGLDISAITGYAFGVVDRKGSSLRISLDDIALIK